jgi:hypothetical protein
MRALEDYRHAEEDTSDTLIASCEHLLGLSVSLSCDLMDSKPRDARSLSAWSHALDLVAMVGIKLEKIELFQRALRKQNYIDARRLISSAERFNTSPTLTHIIRLLTIYNQRSEAWATLNWWISIHSSLRVRIEFCDLVQELCFATYARIATHARR